MIEIRRKSYKARARRPRRSSSVLRISRIEERAQVFGDPVKQSAQAKQGARAQMVWIIVGVVEVISYVKRYGGGAAH